MSALVGRVEELRALDVALADSRRRSSPAVALVVGEAGIGKTTLLAALWSGMADGLRLWLVGYEHTRMVPFGATIDLLRKLRAAPTEGSRLARLLTGEAEAGSFDPARVLEAARAALWELVPALIVLDDLQWVDDTSLALCHYLVRAAADEHVPLGLVCASRPGAPVAAFQQALHGLGDTVQVVDLTLGPLDAESGAALAQHHAPSLELEAAAQVYREAAGSPFWIAALARRQHPTSPPADPLTRRLASLPPEAAQLLALMTVVARPIRYDDLAGLSGWYPDRVAPAIASLCERAVATSTGPMVQLVHDLVRSQARDQLPEREVARLHLQIAEWLEATAGNDLQLLLEAVDHRAAAAAHSADLLLRITRSPRRRLLDGGSLAALVEATASLPPADHHQLRVQVARLAGELGNRRVAYEAWAGLSEDLGSTQARARAALEAARQAIDLERSDDAARMIERARAGAGDDGWLVVGADALDHTRLIWLEHDIPGARKVAEAAVARARRLLAAEGSVDHLDTEDRRAYVDALDAAWDVALTDDDAGRLRQLADERIVATRGLGEEHLIAQADAGRICWFDNQWRTVRVRVDGVLREARAQVYPGLIADLCHLRGYVLYVTGELDEAMQAVEEALTLERRLGGPTRRAVPWVQGGLLPLINASRNSWQDALRDLLILVRAETNPHRRLRLRHWTALVASRFAGADSSDLVLEQVRAGTADADEAGCARCAGDLCLSSVETLSRIGALDLATDKLLLWDAAHPTPHRRPAVERAWYGSLLGATTSSGAIGDLTEVVEALSASGARLDELWALIDLGDAQVNPTRPAAITTWIRALGLAERIGAGSEADLLRRRLRQAGARVHRHTQDRHTDPLVAALTARELEVARLAASGNRNGEIAATLFLSTKTVERHLSNVFAKLAVRSRAELGSRFGEHLRSVRTGTSR